MVTTAIVPRNELDSINTRPMSDQLVPPLHRLSAANAESLQRRAAGWFAAQGCRPGDRVAIDCDSSAAYLVVVISALRIGVVPVPLSEALSETERAELLSDADVGRRIGPADWASILDQAEVEISPIPLTRPMLYTSGTTGHRKGVWVGVWDADTARRAYLDEHDQWGFCPEDTHLVCSPLYHSAPLRFAMHTLLAGGEVLLQPRFDAAKTAQAIADATVTTAFMVPTHLQRIMDLKPEAPSPRMRWLAHAGSPCPPPLKRSVIKWAGASRIWEFYGSTEAQFTTCRGDEWLASPGTVGRARRGRSLSVDDDRQVWCTQPDFARFRYWRSPEKTDAAWRGDECTVGDLGSIDETGSLVLDGRRDDLIVSGGVNVYPAEVERVLVECPGVRACAVFGIDDEQWGQTAVCCWVGDLAPEKLEEYCRQRLPAPSRPRHFCQVDEMPLGTLGKTSRRQLAQWYSANRL